MKRYIIADISIEIEDGKVMYWANTLGYHAEQGGRNFGNGNFGTNSIEATLEILKQKLTEAQSEIEAKAKAKK